MTSLLPCVEVEPKQPARAAVIWLHGLGADGHDFEPIVPMLGTSGVRFVFPHASPLPVTINGGFVMRAWYDIRSLDFDARDREDATQIARSAGHIRALVERELGRGIPSQKIVIAGFSQGAAMALHVGVRHELPLAGIMALSGYLVCEDRLDAERSGANRQTCVFGGHGAYDDVVPLFAGHRWRDALVRTGTPAAELAWHEYPMGHEVSPPQLQHVGAWLAARLH
jgi:phospholipase/carboxylesterase